MKEKKDRALEIINKYENQLASVGIKIAVTKKYFETKVQERSRGIGGQAVFNSIDRALDRQKEEKYGYDNQNNKYHVIVLSVLPIDKTLIKRDDCRDYAFVLQKVSRAHIGQEPKSLTYKEDKILYKIKKRVLKILKKASKNTVTKVCKNTFWDAFRYTNSTKYEYKTKFCNKERFTWDMIFMFLAVAVVVLVILIAWAIGRFF